MDDIDVEPDAGAARRTETVALGRELSALVTSTRVTVLLVLTAVLVVLSTIGTTRFAANGTFLTSQALGARTVVDIMASCLVIGVVGPLLLGALARPRARDDDGEGPWLLAYGATAVAHAVVALVYAAVAVGLGLVTIMAVASFEGAPTPELIGPDTAGIVVATFLAYGLWAVIGVGAAAIADSQAVAVAAGLVWLWLERVVLLAIGAGDQQVLLGCLPLSATEVLLQGPTGPRGLATGVTSRPGAGLVLAGYALAVAVLGAVWLSRRTRPVTDGGLAAEDRPMLADPLPMPDAPPTI